MKIAVTATSGKFGGAILKQLAERHGKENVIGIARTPERVSTTGIEVREGDYNNREQFTEALKGVDVLLLVSGMDHPEKRIQQHRNIIEAARQNGVRKIVYTSIVGDSAQTAFSPIVESNRQTEKDIQESGMEWVIGRNSLYIEPDLEYISQYISDGGIINCAGEGRCAYTSRDELAEAYTSMLLEVRHNGEIYTLAGEPITQEQLAGMINQVYNTRLDYRYVTFEEYLKERTTALGEFLGTIIAGIYQGISLGAFDVRSDYEKATGRPHKSPLEMIRQFRNEH